MEELSQIFKPFFIVGKFLGFFPFYISKGVAKTSPIHVIYSLFFIIAYTSFSNEQNRAMLKFYKQGSSWFSISFELGALQIIQFLICTAISSFVQRRFFSKGLKKIVEIDEKFEKSFKTKIDYKFQKRLACFLFIFNILELFLSVSAQSIFNQNTENVITFKDSLRGLPMLFVFLGQLTYGILYLLLVMMIRMRIKILNKNVKKISEVSDFKDKSWD